MTIKSLLKRLQINIPVRFRNWTFWTGVIGVIGTALQIDPAMLTSWEAVWAVILDFAGNPYQIGCVVFALMGVFVDPTTAGIGDSARAMTYTRPYRE